MEGDIIVMGGATNDGGPERTFLVLDVTGDLYCDVVYPCEVVTYLDGGQRDNHRHQLITRHDHEWQGDWDIPGGPQRPGRHDRNQLQLDFVT